MFGFVRVRGDATAALLATPVLLAYWTAIGLRASFFVPSELPAASAFHANAPSVSASYRGAIRASIIGFMLPAAAVLALAVGGTDHAFRVAVVVVTLANLIVLTIDFVPFNQFGFCGNRPRSDRWCIRGDHAMSAKRIVMVSNAI